MPDCDDCEDPLVDGRDKNEAGWWRDRCLPCIGREGSVLLTDGGQPDQFRVTIECRQTDDGAWKAHEPYSPSDLYGRGQTPQAAVAHYAELVGDGDE